MGTFNQLSLPFFISVLCSNIVFSVPTIPKISTSTLPFSTEEADIETSPPTNVHSLQEKVEITYNTTNLKEISHNVLQVVGDKSKIELTCHSVENKTAPVLWTYLGVERKRIGEQISKSNIANSNRFHLDLSSGPPVALIQCKLQNDTSSGNTVLIYTGDGNPPYLYNYTKSVDAIVVRNKTTARFPCVLNYPLDNNDQVELQLLKDGKLVVDNSSLSYTPGIGFYLNLIKFENSTGNYECRVANSTHNDFLTVTLNNGRNCNNILPDNNNISLKFIDGNPEYFLTRKLEQYKFQCKLPRSMFENRFMWFYRLCNGTYIGFNPEGENETDLQYYFQTVNITFANSSSNFTGIVCSGLEKGSQSQLNKTFAVEVRDSYKPEMLDNPPKFVVDFYNMDTKLTCRALAYPHNWTWLKNGKPFLGNTSTTIYSNGLSESSIVLNQMEITSQYTCIASNFLGEASHTFEVWFINQWMVWVGVILVAIAATVGITLVFFKVNLTPRKLKEDYLRRFFEGEPTDDSQGYPNDPYDKSREIHPDELIFDKRIQEGNFGEVYLGRRLDKHGDTTLVAIKTIKDDRKADEQSLESAFLNFENEIKFVQTLGSHHNVVGYIGATTSHIEKYNAYLVLEYCREGDLRSYLKNVKSGGGTFHDEIKNRDTEFRRKKGHSQANTTLKTSHLLKWAKDIATGMEYIASKNCVHNDLAARNILLAIGDTSLDDYNNSPDPGKLVAKISDFGLSRNLDHIEKNYYKIVFDSTPKNKRRRELPVPWLSIEALKTLRFTTQSDVWSVGVIFWEMFTFGNTPYDGDINIGGCEGEEIVKRFIEHLENGHRLPQPEVAPEAIWDLMLECWEEQPDERPTFTDLKQSLQTIELQPQPQTTDSQQESVPAVTPYVTAGIAVTSV